MKRKVCNLLLHTKAIHISSVLTPTNINVLQCTTHIFCLVGYLSSQSCDITIINITPVEWSVMYVPYGVCTMYIRIDYVWLGCRLYYAIYVSVYVTSPRKYINKKMLLFPQFCLLKEFNVFFSYIYNINNQQCSYA